MGVLVLKVVTEGYQFKMGDLKTKQTNKQPYEYLWC